MSLIDTKLLGVFWNAIKEYTGELMCTSDKAKKDQNGNVINSYYLAKSNVVNKGNENTPIYFNSSGVATPISYYNGECAVATVAKGLSVGDLGEGDKLFTFKNDKLTVSTSNIGASNGFVYVKEGEVVASTETKGSATKLMFLDKGKFWESSSTVGNEQTQPVYLNNGIISPFKATMGGYKTDNTYQLTYWSNGNLKEATSTIGTARSPLYLNNGKLTRLSDTIGSVKKPIYLKDGYFTECDQYPANLLLDKIYPIGSIYMSTNSTSPATFLGGTWTQIKGRFLIGTGTVDANTTDYWGNVSTSDINCPPNEKGGEAWHTLTTNEMPKHTHTATQTSHYHGVGDIFGSDNQGDFIVLNAERQFTLPTNGGKTYWNGRSGGNGFTPLSTLNGEQATSLEIKDKGNSENPPIIANNGGGVKHNNMPPYLSVYMWERTK